MATGTHYSLAFDASLVKFGEVAWDMIRDTFPNKVVLVYFMGFSGAAHGTSVLSAYHRAEDKSGIDMRGAYVRKDGEAADCHGMAIEHNLKADGCDVMIFVDDFVCSGGTYREATAAIRKVIKNRGGIRADSRYLICGPDNGYWEQDTLVPIVLKKKSRSTTKIGPTILIQYIPPAAVQ